MTEPLLEEEMEGPTTMEMTTTSSSILFMDPDQSEVVFEACDGLSVSSSCGDDDDNNDSCALNVVSKLNADQDIEDVINKAVDQLVPPLVKTRSTEASNATTSSVKSYPASESGSRKNYNNHKTTRTTTTSKLVETEARLVSSMGPSSSSSETVTISRRYLRLLTVLALVGCVVGTAALVVGFLALFHIYEPDSNELSSSSSLDLGNADSDSESGAAARSLLDVIYERGVLRCGLNTLEPGFFFQKGVFLFTQEPVYVGFDVDICSAIAAAIFGDAQAYEPIQNAWGERWTKLNATEIDMVFRSTYNMQRDVYIEDIGTGVEFSSPYFYDGMAFGGLEQFVECAENLQTAGPCADLRICVPLETLLKELVEELFPPEHVVGVVSSVESFPTECNVIAAEKNQVNVFTIRQQGYEGEYVAGTALMSKEPVGIVTRQGDPQWTDFVEVVLQSLVYAEEQRISQTTYDQMPSTNLFGPRFESMFKNAVAARGNYGEIYNRNLEHFLPRAGLNLVNQGEAAIWSLPFGNLKLQGPALEDVSPTVRAIKERGFLRCAKVDLEAFVVYDPEQRDFFGFDIELCRALSVALFDGVERYLLVDTNYGQRWKLIQDQKVDVLAFSNTWTIERDVREPTTMTGYSFTDPYIHFWFGFGGVPEYVDCADRLDVASPECQSLRICTLEGTSLFDNLKNALGSAFYLVPVQRSEMVTRLREGRCNVMFNARMLLSESSVRASGYGADLPYGVGLARFNLEPFGMVTRQDDPAWSDFVRWILWALIYAEEEGITQATAHLMPRPAVFGPSGSKFFYHAVNAVGNYGEMYARNIEPVLPRVGRNQLNDNNQPRLYSIPGFGKS